MSPESNTGIGTLLDQRYQIVQKLSQGGFGHTYLAQDTRRPGNPTCVVKHLQPATSDPEFLETARRLFNSEAETLENLGSHDQIPRLLAYFEEHEEFFLVEEYIEGSTLSAELRPGQRWSDRQVVQLLQEVLPILEFIHDRGVIHRDLKPDNLIRRACDRKLVLVDFGAVKQIKIPAIATPEPLNSETVAIGTPGYMPSEQSQGRPRPSSDIYALGTIAIQALTGISPAHFTEDSETGELLWREYAQTNELLSAILTQMVRHYFVYRYQSAAEVLQALEPLLQPYTPKALAIALKQMGRYYLNSGYQTVARALRAAKRVSSRSPTSGSGSYIPARGAAIASPTPATPTLPLAASTQKTVTITPTYPNPSQVVAPPTLETHSSPPRKWLWLTGTGVVTGVVAIAAISNLRQLSSVPSPQPSESAIAATSESPQSAQPSLCLLVVSPSNVRSEPGGNKTGKVIPAGKATATGKEESGWIEVSVPESGWIWKSRTKSCNTNNLSR
jgi:serine/threonine protein kinase